MTPFNVQLFARDGVEDEKRKTRKEKKEKKKRKKK